MSVDNNGPIIGIDLGTTNSVVAAAIDGKIQVIHDAENTILPSVVGLDADGKLLLGHPAKNQQIAFPERTIASVKREMGKDVRLPLADQHFTPQEISAMLLRRLADIATKRLGRQVSRAVITVPAFFNENQRQATREAGQLAGLTVERIINEPTAATLVYHSTTEGCVHLVVYDFGGGTFDVSIVRMESGVTEVLSSKGDTQLGGDDFDRRLMEFVAEDFLSKHGVDLRDSKQSRWRLLRACEQAKCELSSQANVTIAEEFIAEKEGQPLNLEMEITRKDYETLILPLVDRTINCVDEALRDAHLTIDQIDDLILVGGTTRTPLVQTRLRDEFRREPRWAVDPDLAVALGAATQAAMTSGLNVGPVLVDVTSRTLGVEVLEGSSIFNAELIFSPIIHRNSPLPACHEQEYTTATPGQEKAEIHVMQGEHRQLDRNLSIGKFCLEDLESNIDSAGEIVVRFELTLDGTLNATAIEKATGKRESLKINNAISQFQDEDRQAATMRLEDMFSNADLPSSEIQAVSAPISSQPEAISSDQTDAAEQTLLKRAQEALQHASQEDAEEIKELTEQLQNAVEAGDTERIKEIHEEMDDILFYVSG